MENLPQTEPVVPQPDQQPITPTPQPTTITATQEQQPLQSPLTTTTPVVTPTPQKTNSFILLIIGILLLLFLGVGGFLFYKNLTTPESIPLTGIATDYGFTLEIPETTEASPSTVVDEARGWKEYNNYELEYSFKHPQQEVNLTTSCTPYFENGIQKGEFKYIFYDSSAITNNQELMAVCEPEYENKYLKLTHSSSQQTCAGSTQKITVAGVTATQCSGKTDSNTSTETSVSLFIPIQNRFVIIEVNSKEYLPVLQNSIDTFAFETREPISIEEETP